ncbi:hypothetical protein IV38_GL000719 [Lactobacillus selangorensis]|uniref:Uncharacterized protein n=1 Tax=Lactobacillus selangorensis TaxID=81857 RepID=A0A0R2FQD2_9LACO|nr:hypothetical protein [Lactobacillus selangorensis]KRN27227.1 hypothetical protein IV38_GL000719 [Lactobacillus selangorensis]KRN29851.1 hypothetical protein IV40_GL000559 [Lactobacillus selangorensis]
MDQQHQHHQHHRHHRNKKRRHVWGWALLIIAVIVVACFILYRPINNTFRQMSGGSDTPTDKVEKTAIKTVVKKKTNSATAAKIEKILDETPLSEIQAAANNKKDAAKLISKVNGKSTTANEKIVKKVYADSRFNDARQDLNNGDLTKLAKDYQSLKKSGALDDITSDN